MYCKMDRGVLVRGLRQVQADFQSGNGQDVDGTRHDVSVGAMDILNVVLGFFCGQPQQVRLGDPEFQKKMVVWLQDGFDAGDITVNCIMLIFLCNLDVYNICRPYSAWTLRRPTGRR